MFLKWTPDFRKDVAVSMDEDGFKHVRQHVLDLVRVLLQLLSSRHQRLQPVRRPFVAALLLLSVVLTLGVLKVD